MPVGTMASAATKTGLVACTDVITLEPFNNFTDNSWTNSGGTIIAGGRNGNAAQTDGFVDGARYTIPTINQDATVTVGFAFKSPVLSSFANVLGFYSDSAATFHLYMQIHSTGALRVQRGDFVTTLGTSAAGVITANTWHYIEVQATLHDTTGAVQVKVNGTSVLNVTNVDTKNAGTKTVLDTIKVMGTGNGGSTLNQFDDLYLRTGSTCAFRGDINPTLPRPLLVGTPSVFPASNTAATALTITVPTPAGAASGEGLLVCLRSSATTASDFTAPTGWARIGLAPTNDAGVRIIGWFFTKLAAAPAATYDFTSPAAGRFGAIMFRVQGVHATQPHVAAHAYGPRTGTSVTVYEMNASHTNTPTEDSTFLVGLGMVTTAGVSTAVTTAPAGMTLVTSASFGLTAGSLDTLHIWREDLVPGVTVARSATLAATPSQGATNGVVLRKA